MMHMMVDVATITKRSHSIKKKTFQFDAFINGNLP